MSALKGVFNNIKLKQQVIDIPYVLYCALRKKLYGNTYVFPYLVDEGGGTLINQANNTSEWNEHNDNIFQSLINTVTNTVGGMVAAAMGSNGRPGKMFPAPTWGGPQGDKISFNFDLILINDNANLSRNNYMCVNTIIHNNRSMQKTIMQFPGALYELWLPTGQRHLMCTCDLKLYPLGLNRKVPTPFF